MEKYDAIIIGSGQAANPLAKKLAAAGWRTALIEKKWIGGTCINTGCTPSKTAIASGRVAYLTKRSADFGIRTTGWSVDMETVVRRKNAHVLAARESSSKRLLETPNLKVHFGTALFTGPKEVTVLQDDGSTATITAEHIFLNTGTRPVIPPIPGLAEIPFFTSENILDLLVVPAHLAIIGGGYIALELGQLYRRLGSEVTIIEGNTRFLSKEDPDIAAEMKKVLEDDGINILTGTAVDRVEAAPPGIRLELGQQTDPARAGASPVQTSPILASHVLVATGRMPDTATLNPGVAGIDLDEHGFIVVNDKLETTVPGIYALGDVKGGPQFTHVSYNDQLIVYQNLIEKAGRSIAGRPLLYCVFTDPELGRVGLTETAAREKGLDIKVATMRAERIARAWENSETRGLLKAIVDARSKKILGAAILASGGGELMSILQMAMMGDIPYDTLRDTMFAHPTFAESLNVLFAEIH